MLGLTLAQHLLLRFLRTIFGVFATVFGLIYAIDFVMPVLRPGDAPCGELPPCSA